MICSFASFANAAPPVVSGVTASQRAGSKIVDISYNVTMDAGQTAFVELWFSPDNGLNFPIRCLDITGDVDANVSAGVGKSVEWNAESDWDQQFTANGRVRVIATYGDQASGFTGSGEGGNAGQSGGQADASMKMVYLNSFKLGNAGVYYDETAILQSEVGAQAVRVDPTEITNAKWNEVVEWGNLNNYSGLPLGPSTNSDFPRTGITFWQVVKWCNARSEMDGLKPAYYTDPEELLGDFNNDGIIQSAAQQPGGGDQFYSHDPAYDTNMNGQWDPGENFSDNNGNGVYDGDEYVDLNQNNSYDPGRTMVFRTGASIPFSNFGFDVFIDKNATGYRIPPHFLQMKLATGGNDDKKWPWGDEDINTYVNLDQGYRIRENLYTSASPASDRTANGYDLFDMLGNVGEYKEMVYEDNYSGPFPTIVTEVYGGSFYGPTMYHTDPASGFSTSSTPFETLFDLSSNAPVDGISPAVGFRCFVKAE
jgi:formylglycine-generating enzyme required for sulfatase activity